jgi:molecular chaperone DnaK
MEKTQMKISNDAIRIGIDLGTTNSEIAINDGLKVEVINNSEGSLYTPSVVGFSRNKNLIVGREAYDQLFKSASSESTANYQAEVKRKMGLNEKVSFSRSERVFSPEELSSEILKVLKNDVLRRYSDMPTHSAVITIPMAFGTVQSEATKRAGELAGFNHVVILQEPIAAAIAYGLKNSANENWLVYDLGGGTFDVALIAARDGSITVLEHGGNNFLGGKDFDELLIQEVIKKKILEKYTFNNLDLSLKSELYNVTYCHLKALAETAKIKLSTQMEVTIDVVDVKMTNIKQNGKSAKDLDFTDEDGNIVDFSFNLTRAEYDKLIARKVNETIELTNKVISDSKIQKATITKVILVGAPTLTPIIRHRIQKEIGIKVDTSMNPFTVVAEGAAIFALSQKVPQEVINKDRNISTDEFKLTLNYETMTNDFDMLVTGSIEVKDKRDYFIKVSSDSGPYNSEKIKLQNKSFSLYIGLEKQKQNLFWVYLIDEMGNNLNVYPHSFSVTQGMSLTGAPIPHAVGIIYSEQQSNGEWIQKCFKYFDRKSQLPLSKISTFKTIKDLLKGETALLPIEVYEGDYETPDLNKVVTRIEIDGSNLPFTLKKGSEVDIQIKISESRILEVEAYIPEIDLSLNARADVYNKNIEDKELEKQVDTLQEGQEMIVNHLNQDQKDEIQNDISEIKQAMSQSLDAENKQKLDGKIKQTQDKLEKLKHQTSFDRILESYETLLVKVESTIEKISDDKINKPLFETLDKIKAKATTSVKGRDAGALKIILSELERLKQAAITSSPDYWIGFFAYLINRKDKMANSNKANELIAKGKSAIDNDDFDALKNTIVELSQLLPKDDREDMQRQIAGITR